MLELRSVTLIQDTTVFGMHGKQLSATMNGISLKWDNNGKKVVVTHSGFAGKEEWILQAFIGKLVWVDPEAEQL